MDNQTKNLIRVGTVCNINAADQTVRVEFDDLGTTSNWMQILALGASKDNNFWMPEINEQVLCLLMPTGNAEGYVLGSIRGSDNTPTYQDANKRYTSFSDGGLLMYDKSSNTLTIKATNIVITGDISQTGAIKTSGSITASGDVTAGGISLESHVHDGVTTGSGETGEPQ